MKRYILENRAIKDSKTNKTLYYIDSYIDQPVIDLLNQQDDIIKELENQLKQKFEDMSMTDFIRMAKKNGYEVQVNKDVDCDPNNKKLAIKYLKEVQIFITDNAVYAGDDIFGREINDFIDNKIKELEVKE